MKLHLPKPRFLKRLAVLLLPACIVLNLLAAWRAAPEPLEPRQGGAAAVEFPTSWQGRPLRPLALSEVEQRFARGFPGRIARLGNDRDMMVWRHVTRPTRMLHPATDCYRALGWRIRDERLEQREEGGRGMRWRCFTAEKGDGNTLLRICERIEDSTGKGFSDTSAWYWAAVTGQSTGPWQAVTVASPM